jgi:ribosome-binding factor A
MTERTKRVDELLRQEIGEIISRELADPRIGFVTITNVETTPDLRHARVWVSVIGTDDEREAALRSLAHAMPFVRHELGGRLRLRRIPELHVRADDTLVLHLLTELEAGTDPAELGGPEDSLPTPRARLPHEGDAAIPKDDPLAAAPVPEPKPRRRRDHVGAPSTPRGSRQGGRRAAPRRGGPP